MALTVGELAATITVDDAEAEQGLTGFQARLRSALARAVQRARSGGQEAGDALGEGLDDGASHGADAAGSSITGKLKGLALGAIGGSLGAALMAGIGSAMEQQQITAKLSAQLGSTPAEAARYGKIAGHLYADAITEDFQGAAEAIRAVMGAELVPADATNAQIQSIATNAQDLATTFEVDLTTATQAAGAMIKNGLAKDGTQAFDLLTKGMQGLGPAGEDLVETFREYSPVFKQAGISGETALGLMRQALQGGWTQDTDKIADAFKELQLRATEGSTGVQDALKTLGLSAKQTGDDIAAGGKRGETAMGKVLDKLRTLGPNTQEAKQIVSTLFGGPGEDLGAALFALDVDKASKSMGGAAGAAGKMGDALRENASTQVEQFKRKATQAFVQVLADKVLPILTQVGDWFQSHPDLAKALTLGVTALGIAFGIAAISVWAMNSALLANPIFWVIAGIAIAVVLIIAYWDQIKAATIAVWNWVVDKVKWAANMALQVFLNFTLPGLIISHWDQIKAATLAAWDWVVGKVRGAVNKILAVAGWFARLPGMISGFFGRMKDAAVNKASELVRWVTGLPGRITRAVGNIGSLLYSKGVHLIEGLMRGVWAKAGWLRAQLIGFAKSQIPGPIASALGIHSPSRVMRDQIGRWIPAGIVEGINRGTGAVDRAMSNLVNVPTAGQATAATVAAGTASTPATGGQPTVIQLTSDGSRTGDLLLAVFRDAVKIRGGNVQFAVTGRSA